MACYLPLAQIMRKWSTHLCLTCFDFETTVLGGTIVFIHNQPRFVGKMTPWSGLFMSRYRKNDTKSGEYCGWGTISYHNRNTAGSSRAVSYMSQRLVPKQVNVSGHRTKGRIESRVLGVAAHGPQRAECFVKWLISNLVLLRASQYS